MAAFLHELPENTAGRDFIVGDIHGHFAQLERELEQHGFDPARDRVLAVGDLVDRGPQSPRALTFLGQPWFFSVRGNHEQAMLDWLEVLLAGATPEAVRESAARHVGIGGDWVMPMLMAAMRGDRETPARWREALAALPWAIATTRGGRRVGIVHATVPGADWAALAAATPDARTAQATIWSRRPLEDAPPGQAGVRGIDLVFAGHNLVDRVQVLGNFHMIETGAWTGRPLTVLDLDRVIGGNNAPGASLLARWLGRRGKGSGA